MKAKRLIEVAMPIKEISAESVRDKSIRHGHISTLHLWWARRPLPVCRAIVFASLLPDPLDEKCPEAFKQTVEILLNTGLSKLHYKPYKDIPYTSVDDEMEDNHRNRLMMFIGKFSDKCQANMIAGKTTSPKEQLDDWSLIKWENRNNPQILRIARELLFIAYQSEKRPNASREQLNDEFNLLYNAILKAEKKLYELENRHIETDIVKKLETDLRAAIDSFQDKMPSVFDPFAGGGAIPLEAARLGCRSYGNDINPVAYIIERCSAEFPQRYGKAIVYSKDEFEKLYGKEGIKMSKESDRGITFNGNFYYVPNRLSFDVEFYARRIIDEVKNEIGHLYPLDENGNIPIAYYWARTAKCSNPSCGAVVPLFKQFYLVNTSKKQYYLHPLIEGTDIQFEIKKGRCNISGWNHSGNMICPCCGSVTTSKQVKDQANKGLLGERLIAIFSESDSGKQYLLPNVDIKQVKVDIDSNTPIEYMTDQSDLIRNRGWGINQWYQMFSGRQLNMLQSFVKKLHHIFKEKDEYHQAVYTYLSIWFDRIAIANTALGRWHNGRETIEHPFSRQAIAMTFDYPESNPFCSSSGSALNQLEWVLRYLEQESNIEFPSQMTHASSGEKEQFASKSLTAVITDPPYYDAIAYADISDFFYVWMKKTLGNLYPIDFSTPQTPKADECTALKHHHNNCEIEAKTHFENKLTQIFDAIEQQTQDVVSIMFAHQSTQAWTTLCNSILGARMNITGSWPIDTEMTSRSIALSGAALESSVTVSCRPSERNGFGYYKDIKEAIAQKVEKEVEALYALGFRGADLLTACFGQAVSEFGKYKSVEKADGSEVTVAELLDMARTSAFNALLKGVQGDELTRFYIGWLQMNGMGETDFDDATKFTRVGMSVDVSEIFAKRLLIRDGKKQHLATAEEHIGNSAALGTRQEDSLIDQVHRAMIAYEKGDRSILLTILHNVGADDQNAPFWRLAASLKELLPDGKDLKSVEGLLGNSDNLRQESRDVAQHKPEQMTFDFGSDFNNDFK